MVIDFTPIIEARISDGHFRDLLRDVGQISPSRMSVYSWVRELNEPSKEYAEGLVPFIAAVAEAVAEGELPLPVTCKRADKYKALQDIIFPRLNIAL